MEAISKKNNKRKPENEESGTKKRKIVVKMELLLKERADVAQSLIIKGAEIDPKDVHQKTPLHYAAQNGLKDIAQLLLDGGADVNAKDVDQKTPLHYVAAGLEHDDSSSEEEVDNEMIREVTTEEEEEGDNEMMRELNSPGAY